MAAQFKRRLSASARRERIVAAALELFAQRGYEGVAMADIAAAADVSRSVLYDHFPAKRELFLTLLTEQAAALLSDVAGRIVAAGTPRERMRSTVDAFFASVAAHPFAWRMVVRESTGDAEVAAAHRKLGSEHTAAVRAMLAADMRKGGIDPDSARAEAGVELVITAILGLALWWHERPDVARETLVDAVMDVLWVGLERSAGLT